MRALNFFSWPIWGKLLAAFATVSIVMMLMLMVLNLAATNNLSTGNLRAFVLESGSRQQAAIQNELNGLLNLLQETATNELGGQRPAALIRALSQSPTASEYFLQLLNRVILSTGGAVRGAWLLDLQGQVLLSAGGYVTLPLPGEIVLLPDQSASETFRIGEQLTRAGGGQTQAVVLPQDESQVLQVVTLLQDVLGRTQGYLVAEINLAAAAGSHLQFSDTSLGAYSYLVVQPGQAFMLPDAAAHVVADSTGASRALTGLAGLDSYTINSPDGPREVLAYYGPIGMENLQFALVTELDTAIIDEQLNISRGSYGPPLLIFTGILISLVVFILYRLIAAPLAQMENDVRAMAMVRLDTPVPVQPGRSDEIGRLQTALETMRQNLNAHFQELNADIARRIRDIRTTQEISRVAASQRSLDALMETVVNLIVERIEDIYHAQIFLVDYEGRYAILQASTGKAGRELLQRGHRLEIGSISVVGQAAEQGVAVVVRNISTSEIHRRNEFLPDTQAEAAIPLRLGRRVIGVLDVQSRLGDSLDDDLITILQTLADQITVAIENARLYEESLQRITGLQQSLRQDTRRDWEEFLSTQRVEALAADYGTDTGYDFTTLRERAVEEERVLVGEVTERGTVPIAIPVSLRGEVLGAVTWELLERDFNHDTLLLAEELVGRLAISLDNARLFQESRRAADRERIVNTIAAKLSSQTSIEQILQTAVREVGQALHLPRVDISLGGGTANGEDIPGSES